MLASKRADILLAEVNELLLLVGIHSHAEHFSTFTTNHLADCSANWRGKLNLRILLVNEQSIPGLDLIALLDNNLWSYTLEIIGYKRELAV